MLVEQVEILRSIVEPDLAVSCVGIDEAVSPPERDMEVTLGLSGLGAILITCCRYYQSHSVLKELLAYGFLYRAFFFCQTEPDP